MKSSLFFLSGFCLFLAACGDSSDTKGNDSAGNTAQADSIPREVRVGKDATWAYKPDTMINTLLLGDVASLKEFMHKTGNNGTTTGNRVAMYYFNAGETEFMTVFAVMEGTKYIPYGLRIEKNSDTLRNYKLGHNYAVETNFITSSGVYIGMSVDFVQNIYKSQTMTMWTKGDTTYLHYVPVEKDAKHYKRYLPTEYSATYKFVNDKCRWIEMLVDPKSFDK